MVDGSVSFISLSDFSSLMYRNARDFCAFIFYRATLPNPWISSTCFLVASLGFSKYSVMQSAKSDSVTSSFPTCVPFISFAALTAVARTWSALGVAGGQPGEIDGQPSVRVRGDMKGF